MSIVKNSIWEKMSTLGEVLSEETVLSVDNRKRMVTLKSMPLNPIPFDTFMDEYKNTGKFQDDGMSGLKELLGGGFSHLKQKTPKKEVVQKEQPQVQSVAVPQQQIVQVVQTEPQVEIDQRVKSVLDLTKDSIIKGDLIKALNVVKMMDINIEDFVHGLVHYNNTKDVIELLVGEYVKEIFDTIG